jgi:hypothetical protein
MKLLSRITLLVLAAASIAGCSSDEQRAREILEVDGTALLDCLRLYDEAMAALKESYESIHRGDWSSAGSIARGEAGPATEAFTACTERERAVLTKKLLGAGIPPDVASRVWKDWWRQQRQQMQAASDPEP